MALDEAATTVEKRRPSALKPVLFTIDRWRVLHAIGALTPGDLDEVDKRLRIALNL